MNPLVRQNHGQTHLPHLANKVALEVDAAQRGARLEHRHLGDAVFGEVEVTECGECLKSVQVVEAVVVAEERLEGRGGAGAAEAREALQAIVGEVEVAKEGEAGECAGGDLGDVVL